MLSRHFYPLAAALFLLAPLSASAATPGAVQAEQTPPMPGPGGHARGHGDGGKLGGFLSPEQRAMFMLQARDQTKAMTQDQRKAWRKDQLQKLIAMSPADRQKFKTDLEAKWIALPEARKGRIQQRLARQQTQPTAQ
jgi:hypothetical protein